MTAISDQVRKGAEFYEESVYPRVDGFRGATRLRSLLRSASYPSICRELDSSNYMLDAVESFPIFSEKDDLKYYFTEYTPVQVFLEESKDADVFCDVGGYHGFYSLVSNAEVNYCFEVDPENLDRLRKNTSLNSEFDVRVFDRAVWSSNGTVNIDSGKEGESSVSNKGVERQSVTLDTFFKDRTDPDIIKVDVEGGEGHVLDGAEKLLERSHPTLFIEFHNDGRIEEFGESEEQIKEFLRDLSYKRICRKSRGTEVHEIWTEKSLSSSTERGNSQ